MSNCILCSAIREAPRRYTSSAPLGDLVAVALEFERKSRIVICSVEHRNNVVSSVKLQALTGLRDIASRKWGNAFTIDSGTSIESAHWSVSAFRIKTRQSVSEPTDSKGLCLECGGVFRLEEFSTTLSESLVMIRCPRGCCVAHAHADVTIQEGESDDATDGRRSNKGGTCV